MTENREEFRAAVDFLKSHPDFDTVLSLLKKPTPELSDFFGLMMFSKLLSDQYISDEDFLSEAALARKEAWQFDGLNRALGSGLITNR